MTIEQELETLKEKVKLLEKIIELRNLLNKEEYMPYYPPAIVPIIYPYPYNYHIVTWEPSTICNVTEDLKNVN